MNIRASIDVPQAATAPAGGEKSSPQKVKHAKRTDGVSGC